ncbi:MAG: 16S rRNA (cytosine(1402)-N(4))-methyltransferase RsmH [Candidatus Edwardsbacteria bacterium]|jgi:16S rRNA (cytosine1402-N4)-methyltransferase|nr:16S rRNA (cytosine(1402)-N(4))-methyltransferase RsmH [Candidatus Edwardsbacteria bacterium]
MDGYSHTPVLLHRSVDLLAPRPGGTYVDATLGGGGHALELLRRSGPDGLLVGIDRDPMALAAAAQRLAAFGGRVELVRADFGELGAALAGRAGRIDGFLFDLGVSSPQLDQAGRGFSFMADGPLDMRMGGSPASAAEIVNGYGLAELVRVIRDYGEERNAARIARAIVRQRQRRPLATTADLADIVRGTRPAMPAKTLARVFQAVRIEVNGELDSLRRGLEAAVGLLAPAGRIAVISYHSLEDRIAKEFFAGKAAGCTCPPDLPVCACGRQAGTVTILTPRPIVPDDDEQRANPRSRSAKLRAAERT